MDETIPQLVISLANGKVLHIGDMRSVAERIMNLQVARQFQEDEITQAFVPRDFKEKMIQNVQNQLEKNILRFTKEEVSDWCLDVDGLWYITKKGVLYNEEQTLRE